MTSVTPRSEFGNANRSGAFNEGNRFSNASVNRVNNFNNVNRMGLGWNNPYNGYHQGWNHGYWNGNLGGGWGWRPYGYGYGGYGLGGYGLGGFGYGLAGGLGMGLGWGLSSWMYGPMLNNWGYSNYNNPYYGGGYGYGGNVASAQPIVYDYSQPIDPQSAPPDEAVVSQASTVFDIAREAFKNGDYAKALELDDQALKTTPNDAALHEFRALCLFALRRYDEAAAVLYAVLSVGPGWDWTTLIGLYGDPETYTQQLRALENYCSQHTQSAAAVRARLPLFDTRSCRGSRRAIEVRELLAAQGPVDGAVNPTAPAHGATGLRGRPLAGPGPGRPDGTRCRRRQRSRGRRRQIGRRLDGPAVPRHHDHGELCRQRAFYLESTSAGKGTTVRRQVQFRERRPHLGPGPKQQHHGRPYPLEGRDSLYVQGSGRRHDRSGPVVHESALSPWQGP